MFASARGPVSDPPKRDTTSGIFLTGAGTGFTMSLFIGTLAFDDPEHAKAVRIGVRSGSPLSAIAVDPVLRFVAGRAAEGTESPATA